MFDVLVSCAAAITALMVSVWSLSLLRRDVSIVDIAWGLGFVLVAWTAYGVQSVQPSALLLPVLTTLWGTRLSVYLFWRNYGKPEDYRYRAMREKWGDRFPWVSLLTVFGLQGAIMWIVSLPIQVGSTTTENDTTALVWIGLVVWLIGFGFESIADWQLAVFKSNPENQGRVLASGLWRFSRHPNYFGDFLVWWGLFIISFAATGITWTVIGPVMMSVLLMRVSGVTLLEKSLRQTKAEYGDYVANTNAFFPWFPKNSPR